MASSGFIGRERELAAVAEALDGGGLFLLVAGGAGLGKSRLASESVALAKARGIATAWGRCRETEGAPPFWPWTQILRGVRAELGAATFDTIVGPDAPLLAQVLPDLGGAVAARDPFLTYDAAARSLIRLAAERPILLVLDDLHAADVGSLRMLRFVASEIEGARIALVGTYRDDERSEALTELIGEVVTARAVRLLRLEGLATFEVVRLIASVSGATVDESAGRAVHERTNGNPFFVTELARLGLDAPPPESVREAIRARVRKLPPPTRVVLSTSSVLGRDFGGVLLERICEIRGVSLIAAFQPAAQAGLIASDSDRHGYYRFVHALVQEVIYADFDDDTRRSVHALAAEALDALPCGERSARLDELAFHACAAGSDRAAALCEEAARSAKAALAYEDAARWFERCVALDPSRRTLSLLLDHASTLHGPAARARWEEAFEMAALAGDAEAVARAARGVGDIVVSAGVIDDALVRLLERAERLVAPESSASIRIAARRAIELYWQGDRAPSRALATETVARAESSRDASALASALHAQRFVLRGPTELAERVAIGERLVRIALDTHDEELELQSYAWLVPDHMQLGDVAAVDRDVAALDELSTRKRRPLARWYALLFHAMRAAFGGRFEDALRKTEQARSLGRRLGSQPTEVYAAGQRAITLRDLGRGEESIEELRDLAAAYPVLVTLQCELAMLLAETGATAEARELVEVIGADVPRDSLWHASIAFLVQASAALGNGAHARKLRSLLLPSAGRNIMQGVPIAWGAVDHYLGIAAVTAGDLDEAIAHLDDAVRLHTRWGAPALKVASQAELANVLHERGRAADRERVTGLQASVHAEAARLGIVRPLLVRDRTNKRIGPVGGLTEREAGILRLVAAGQANKEIAQVLRISVHTVERHLANIYGKIGVRNRAEATAWAVTHQLAST